MGRRERKSRETDDFEAPVVPIAASDRLLSDAGYRITAQLRQRAHATIYRARRVRDDLPVILKVLQGQSLTAVHITRLRHEYRMLERLDSPGVVKVYDLHEEPAALALVTEDFGGVELRRLIDADEPTLTLEAKLTIALKLVAALRDIHHAHAVHKNVNPNNIVVNRATGEVKLTGFGLATPLAREQAEASTPLQFLGTPAYIAPEQTGRMNRAVDYRSDFYSLGATLFELFTGRVPFPCDDILRQIHCHMAIAPVPPNTVDSRVPETLSAIIVKLLAKAAEDRYQSALSLEADLERCLRAWQARGAIAPFPIDQMRLHDRFQLPAKLYGREADLRALLAAFDHAAAGETQALFVTGVSGVGKTSLVREVHKPVTAKRGFFVSGQFEQFRRNIPHRALFDALLELVRQLLSEDEAALAHWRTEFERALGVNARVLTDVLPPLALIIGEPPPVPILEPAETHQRLYDVLRRFLSVVCQPEHPLVLYLDNLQWADSVSLDILRRVLTDPDLGCLLFIGSYRDNEIDAAHPVLLMREELRLEEVAISQITPHPLSSAHLKELVRDALGVTGGGAQLASLIHAKTGGNPYFAGEFLKSLHAKRILYFDPTKRRWRWDAAAIAGQDVTDNLAVLTAQNLRVLDEASCRYLQLGACIGNVFDLGLLAAIADEPVDDVALALQDAIAAALLTPIGRLADDDTRLRFAHDRVQQAAYQLLPERERARIHCRIGRLMTAKLTEDGDHDDELLQAVNHLNAGCDETDAAARTQLARWNLAAGRRAKTTAAYDVAFDYFKRGIELLGANAWTEHYDVALALNSAAAEMAPLCDAYEEIERRFAQIRAHARTPLDQMPVYETRIAAALRRGDIDAAADAGLEALRLLGVHFPRTPKRRHMLYYTVRAKLALAGRTPNSLLNHPRMTDPRRIAESRLLHILCNVFYVSNRPLLILTLYRFVYICVRFGNSDVAPSMYANYAITLCANREIETGYRFGQLALALVDKLDAREQRPWVTSMVHACVEHWKVHCRRSLPALLDAYKEGLDIGAIGAAGTALALHACLSLYAGVSLPSLHSTLGDYIDTLNRRVKDRRNRLVLELSRDAIADLAGIERCAWITAAADDVAERNRQIEAKHPFAFHFFRGFAAFHAGDYQGAHAAFQQSMKYLYTIVGLVRFFDLYYGLTRVMIHPMLPKQAQRENRKAIRRIRARLKRFAQHGEDNYLHRWHLLEAEFARLQGRDLAAMEHYDLAVDTARLTGHVHEEALANELAGRHYLAHAKHKIGNSYLLEARTLYQRWGAAKKVEWMDAAYPQLAAARTERDTATNATSTHTTFSADLDFPTLTKALSAIAEETIHSRILSKTIQIVMQFAGAEKILLLLRDNGGDLLIEADADTGDDAQPQLLNSIPFALSRRLCHAVVNYVRRAKTSVVIHDAQEPQPQIPGLQNDPYVRENGIKSILCIPIASGAGSDAELIGVLYAEHNRASHNFTERRIATLELICLSVAGRLELSRKAITDSLTGLYNRGYFESSLAKEISAARRKRRPLSVIMLDIDNFKRINDRWGHQIGDAVLRHVAKIVKTNCRDSDVAARYGGEEMVIILPETDTPTAADVAERIRDALDAHSCQSEEGDLPATASFGVATTDAHRDSVEALIHAADEALYRSKAAGRNRVGVATSVRAA